MSGARSGAGAQSSGAIDDAGYRPFHTRLLTYSCGAPFCDGYVLGIIAIALPSLAVSLHLGSGWQGLIAAASLLGMIVGVIPAMGLVDRVGRRPLLTVPFLATGVALTLLAATPIGATRGS